MKYMRSDRAEGLKMESGGFFRVSHNGNFSTDRTYYALDNLFKPPRYFIVIGSFAALVTHAGWNIFNNNNASTHIGGKGRKPFLYCTLAQKTDHNFLGHKTSISADRINNKETA